LFIINPLIVLAEPVDMVAVETGTVLGVNNSIVAEDVNDAYSLNAIITAVDFVEGAKDIYFSSENSIYDPDKAIKYVWNLGDGTIVEGEKILHSYKLPGRYIVSLCIEQENKKSCTDRFVFSYERIMVLITDIQEKYKKIYTTTEDLNKNGVFVKSIEAFGVPPEVDMHEILIKKMNDNIQAIEKSPLILMWLHKTLDFDVLITFFRENPQIDFSKKTFVFITDKNIHAMARYSQNVFDIIEPKNIIITNEDVISASILSTKDPDEFIDLLYAPQIINKGSRGYLVFNFVSRGIQFMKEKGLDSSTILLILIFPLIATIIAFCRQVLGIPTFGVYTPSILTLSLIVLSLKFGLIIFFFVVGAGAVIRIAFGKFRMLYIPKVAIILTGSSFIILVAMAMGSYYKIADITSLAVFPMLIMSTLAEKFVSIQTDRGITKALISTGSTLFVALLSYFIVTNQSLQTYIISYPGWMFLLVIGINVLLGRYTGLRITEYVRFKELFKHMEE